MTNRKDNVVGSDEQDTTESKKVYDSSSCAEFVGDNPERFKRVWRRIRDRKLKKDRYGYAEEIPGLKGDGLRIVNNWADIRAKYQDGKPLSIKDCEEVVLLGALLDDDFRGIEIDRDLLPGKNVTVENLYETRDGASLLIEFGFKPDGCEPIEAATIYALINEAMRTLERDARIGERELVIERNSQFVCVDGVRIGVSPHEHRILVMLAEATEPLTAKKLKQYEVSEERPDRIIRDMPPEVLPLIGRCEPPNGGFFLRCPKKLTQ